ncbi:hypothetical protein BsWGS_03346 [Bradybaena similaris]
MTMETVIVVLVFLLCLFPASYNEILDDGAQVGSLPWWKTTIIYQVYPRSFKDSDGDGIGDLQGVISELQYFKYLGVETIWLSPFYSSPQVDFGYDISDLKDVDPIFGNVADFRQLVAEAKKLGLRILVDFVPNHTSDKHEWFQRSVEKKGKYADYYIWTDGDALANGTRVPPNNWLSVFGGSAWMWNDRRQQFYLHQFDPLQPDLNYRNPDVREEMLLAMRYWLEFGIDGLRMDAINHVYETTNLSLNNPLSGNDVPPDNYGYLTPLYTSYILPETKEQIQSWQGLLDDMEKVDGKERFMVLEFYTDSNTRAQMAEYGAHPFNMDMVDGLTVPLSAKQIMGLIAKEYKDKPESYWPTFVVGNHDKHRTPNRYGRRYVNAFNLLLLTLKGTPTTYYGEEIGMEDITLTYEQTRDPPAIKAGPDRYLEVSRDLNRSPMQWTAGYQSGFSSSKETWLPVQENYTVYNVEAEKVDPGSYLNLYREYASLRSLDSFKYGDIDVNIVTNDNVLSYTRSHRSERYLVAINFGQATSTDDYSVKVNATTGTVVSNTGDDNNSLAKDSVVHLDKLTLAPGNGVVIKL